MTPLSLFPTYTVPQADPTIEQRNRRFTPEVLWRAPLVLMGRKTWDLDAAAELGGSVSKVFINADLDALGPRPWMTYLNRRENPHPLMDPRLPMAWLNPPFLDPFGDGDWKIRWVMRAIEESRRMLVWVLLPLAADDYGWELDQAADLWIDVAWRARFRSPEGLAESSPMSHRHRIWRLSPRGYRDSMSRYKAFTLHSDKRQRTATLRALGGGLQMTVEATCNSPS